MPYTQSFDAHAFLRCPKCKSAIRQEAGSLLCDNRHSYDIATNGHVNFVPNQKNTKYSKTLFESRRELFAHGLYDEITEQISEILRPTLEKEGERPLCILDAGCGEGFFTERLAALFPAVTHFGFDIEKEAIRLAAKRRCAARWLVADIANMPFHDHAVQAIVNILSPANYSEFKRVLSPNGGILVKVIPGREYLLELRQRLSKPDNETSSIAVRTQLEKYLCLTNEIAYKRTFSLTPDMLPALLRMTPMTFDIDMQRADISDLHEITIDLDILVATGFPF